LGADRLTPHDPLNRVMMRHEYWPMRLHALIDDARSREFQWGDLDCCQWGGLVVEALTGTNPISHLRGRYNTAIGAKRLLKQEYGTWEIRDALTQVLGQPVAPGLAGRGDIVLVDIDGTEAVGVVDLTGERVAAVGLYGLEHVPLSAATTAWKV
jgi:hypothetical protein